MRKIDNQDNNSPAKRAVVSLPQDQLSSRLAFIETAKDTLIAKHMNYPAAVHIDAHKHSRNQLLFPASGLVSVSAVDGHWLVPTGQALWIPAGVIHAVDMIGDVQMHSVHVQPDAIAGLPIHLHVAALRPLLRELVYEAESLDEETSTTHRHHIVGAILYEMLRLQELPLELPLPTSSRLLRLCQQYLEQPLMHTARIDNWASSSGVSRRSFTRLFRTETGMSLSEWRQRACLLAALPKLSRGETVTTVALDLGYESAPAFTSMFTRILGRSPLAYVRAMQRDH